MRRLLTLFHTRYTRQNPPGALVVAMSATSTGRVASSALPHREMPGSGVIGSEVVGSRAQITRSRAAWMGEKITQAAAQIGGTVRATRAQGQSQNVTSMRRSAHPYRRFGVVHVYRVRLGERAQNCQFCPFCVRGLDQVRID